MSIQFYDLIGELGTLTLDGSNNPTRIQFVDTGILLTGYRPFYNIVNSGDTLYIKIQQTTQNAYAIVIATYNIDNFGYRRLYVERVLSKYGTLSSGTYGEVTVFNDASANHRVSANQLLVKDTSFIPEYQTSDYYISLSGNATVSLPPANVYTENIKYGFLVASKYSGSDTLYINASGTDTIKIGSNNSSNIAISGVGTFVELVATSGGSWYKLFSTDAIGGESVGSVVGGTNNAVQFNYNSAASGGKAFWDNNTKTLYFGNTNNILNADVILSSSQVKSSGIYPISVKLNSGNFFAVTKDGKVAINTPSLPLYESSPNFHMVGRCAVFEGTCGSAGVSLTLFNNPDVVPPSGSIGGSFNMSARNSNRNVINYAQIQSKILNPNKGRSSGQFLVNVDVSGSPYNVMKLDSSNLQIGNNDLATSYNIGTLGKNNDINHTYISKVIGDNNTLDHVDNVYMLGSNNSIDFIKNSARYILSETNISSLSGLEWNDLDDLQSGDIVQVTNNNVLNGYYVASSGTWTSIDETVAVAYFGTSNFVIGSDSKLSGNNVIVIGSDISASGNNLSVFGNLNNIRTQKISDIINSNYSNEYSTVVGNVNTFDASGLIVLGNRNSGSGINGLFLNGSSNIIGSGTISSAVIGSNNNITLVSGILIGKQNIGLSSLSTIIGNRNTTNLLNSIVIGSQVLASGNNSLLLGNSVVATGNNNVLIGNSGLLIGSSGNIFGTYISATGNNLIAYGSNIKVSGSDNVVLGYQNSLNGEDNLLIGSNIKLSGVFNQSTIHGINNVFDKTNYKYATFIGQNNIVSSGVNNNLLIGTNNTLKNVYDLIIPGLSFSVGANGTKFTSTNSSGLIHNFRADDNLLYTVNSAVVGSGVAQSVYNLSNDLIVEPKVAFSGYTTINIVSTTKQNEIIDQYSRPILSIGNDNMLVGFSGVVAGYGVSVSGYDNTVLGSDNDISGSRNILITNNYQASGISNHINIGFKNAGGLENSTMIGGDNSAISNDNIIVGNKNTVNANTSVLGSDNLLTNSHADIVGTNNTIIAKGQRTSIPLVYDDRNRYDFTGIDHTIIGSGTFSTTYQCLLLDNNINWLFNKEDKAVVQLYDGNRFLPAYIGIISKAPEIVNGFKGIFFDNYLNGTTQQVLVNPTSLLQFVEAYYPNQIPTTLSFRIFHYSDNFTAVYGSGNTIIGSDFGTIMGHGNQIGIDWYKASDVVSSSGLIVGDHNQIYKGLIYEFNPDGTTKGMKPAFPDSDSLFQGAMGFGIKNADPNSIKVGFDTNTIKVFDLGGRKDGKINIITNPSTNPPTITTILGEQVGSGVYSRGFVVNSEAIENSFNILNNGANKPSVLSVISNGDGYVGINNNNPKFSLDVNGSINSSQSVISKVLNSDKLVLHSGAAPGYFLSATDTNGNAEWVAGIKVDVSGYPGTLLYYSGTVETGGKVQPISSTAIVQNQTWQLNTMTYEPSGCNISRSGLLFDQFLQVDKYAVMTLDEHRRSVVGYPIEDVEKLLAANPGRIDYIQKFIDLAKAKNRSDESHFIPRQYNALYFIPESAAYLTPSDTIAGTNSEFKRHLEKAGQAQQAILSIGRRKIDYSQPLDLEKGEDVDPNNALFPGGLSSPQIVLSTIPKKDFAGQNSYLTPKYKFNYDEMISPHLAPYKVPDTNDLNIIKPMTGGTFEGKQYQSWWFYDQTSTTTSPGSIPLEGKYSTIQRAVPTAFNLGRDEIDFVIYGTGSKYPQDMVSKFLFGDVNQYATWKKAGLGREDANFPFLTTIPAFYFNSSINSFMIHTDRPSWVPAKVPPNVCEPCDPIQSGINFADLTVRGWIGTSGIRVGQGFRRALTTNTAGQLIEAVDGQGKAIFETTQGMVLMSDQYGFAVWTPLGGSTSSNNTLTGTTGGLAGQSVQLTEGPLDPIDTVSNIAAEGLDVDSARLYRDNVNVVNENVTSNPVLRLRGVTRNSLLFAKNPLPNRELDFSNKFNESSLPSNTNEMNIDGTENLFYYGYTNALAGIIDFNNQAQTTEIVIDGDGSRRFNIGDVVRLYYKFMANINNQLVETPFIERAKVIGLYTTYLAEPINNRTTRTTVVLDKLLSNVADATYLLDSTSILRKAAIISESIGGYLTFNFPGSAPDVVISNREYIDTSFNANGKNTNFAVYGSIKDGNKPSLLFAEHKTNSLQVNSSIPVVYGYRETVVNNLSPDLEKNINSPLYYDYNWYNKYLSGTYSETDNKIGGATTDIKVGDIVEILYDNGQDIKAIVKTVNASDIVVSFKDINLGMIDNKIGNIARNNTGSIINNQVKYKVIKRQLEKATSVVNGNITVNAKDQLPQYAQLAIRGLTYTDGLMIGNKDNDGNTIIENQSILYSNNGLVSGSNLKYFQYKALDGSGTSDHLAFNYSVPTASCVTSIVPYRDKPDQPESSTNPTKLSPVLANFTMNGNIKITSLYVDNLSHFRTIDGGVVKFRGQCNGQNNVCSEQK